MESIVKFSVAKVLEKEIRITEENGQEWFLVTDICKVLGTSNVSETIAGLDEFVRYVPVKLKTKLGGMIGINYDGLMVLLNRSRKKENKNKLIEFFEERKGEMLIVQKR